MEIITLKGKAHLPMQGTTWNHQKPVEINSNHLKLLQAHQKGAKAIWKHPWSN